jgi:hypothetical protein
MQCADETAQATAQAHNEAGFEREIEQRYVPRYDLTDPAHQRLAALSQRAPVLAPATYGEDEVDRGTVDL